MGRKNNTPQPRRSQQATTEPTGGADDARAALRRKRLGELIDTHFAGSHTAFGSAVGVGATHVKAWLERGVSPGAVKLMKISDKTNASVDWLLGYDVAADRNVRAPAGDFARRLHDELIAVAPPFAPVSLLGDFADLSGRAGWSQQMVRDVVTGWWEQQRASRSQDCGNAVRALAQRLEEEADDVADPRIGTFMRQQARDLSRRYASLLTGEATWRDLLELQIGPLCSEIPGVTALALRNRDDGSIAYLQAPYPALGGPRGVGVAWRAQSDHAEPASSDHAVFIDPATMQAIHVAGGRFLKELTTADRFPATL